MAGLSTLCFFYSLFFSFFWGKGGLLEGDSTPCGFRVHKKPTGLNFNFLQTTKQFT